MWKQNTTFIADVHQVEHLPLKHQDDQLVIIEVPFQAESGSISKPVKRRQTNYSAASRASGLQRNKAAFTCVHQGYQEACEDQDDEPADAASHDDGGGGLLLRQLT